MTRDILIGIDAGTSVIKSVAFDRHGTQLGVFARPNVYNRVGAVGAEQDLDQTWRDTAATLRGLHDVVPSLAERTAAIAVTAQGDGTWLIDDDGRPTGPAMIWLDGRASSVVQEFRGSAAEGRVFARTGTGFNVCNQSAQLHWLKANDPARLARSATALHCKDWLYFRLTDTRASDPSEGIFTYGEIRTRDIDPAVMADLGLADERRLVAPIVDGLTTPGTLGQAAAAETGFPAGLPVVLGYVDMVTTALGAGVFDPGIETGCTVIGSTGIHMRYAPTAQAVRLPSDRTGYTIAFPTGTGYAQLQSNMASTLNIDWVLDIARGLLKSQNLVVSRDTLIGQVDRRVLSVEPGTLLYHPYISEAGERGPFIDPAARAQLLGLNARHRFDHMLRAVFEGLGLAARDCYAAMGEVPKEIRITGGAARSRALRTILAAALGADVRTSSREEAGAAGTAMIAAVALGFYPDMAACTAAWVTPLLDPPLAPDPDLARCYGRLFPFYRDAREASGPAWQALATVRAAAAVTAD